MTQEGELPGSARCKCSVVICVALLAPGAMLWGHDAFAQAAPASSAASGRTRAPAPTREKVTFGADIFFEEGSTVVKPGGERLKVDDFVDRMGAVNVEVVIAVGHTDNIESTSPQKLSTLRAEAVKNYIVDKGVGRNRIYSEGKGNTQPVADNNTPTGRAKNRRVELEVVATRERR